jgi:predicted TIM-barrel fold metal-dependent hydrolase
VKRLLDRFGAKRLMWATNWPVSLAQLPYAKIVELYRDLLSFLSQGGRIEILWKTVQRVWSFEAESVGQTLRSATRAFDLQM